jgi:hypothetical protein
MVVRHDVNVEAIGKMAELPPDLSPLQLGVHGEFEGAGFTLIGRVRLAYDEGSWNEWYALFGDGRFGWVAEAQGFFMGSFETGAPQELPAAEEFVCGRGIELGGQTYRITGRKQTTVLGSEGELPFPAPPGRKAVSVDLTGPDRRFANIEFSDGGIRSFTGRYLEFDELKFSGLRAVPGWSQEADKKAGTTALNCPHCGAAVNLRAAGFSMSAKCDSCGSLLDTATPDLRLIQTAQERQRITPRIPLGRRGTLFGTPYEVVGFQHVKDQYSGWTEYLLFNPWQGFVWLVTYNGHWTFVRRLLDLPVVDPDSGSGGRVHFKGEPYRLFATSEVVTDYVLGEFYWKVQVGMPVSVADYVHPPRVLSRETYLGAAEETWSQGEYVQPKIIQEAFQLEPLEGLTGAGVYLNQPNPHAEKSRQLAWLVPVLILILLAIQLVSAGRAANQQVFEGAYVYRAGATNSVVVTRPFKIAGGKQAVEIDFAAPVENNWLELGTDLVNTDTLQPIASFEQGIEYYHGYDEGNWSEGNRSPHHLIPAVPAGNYCLAMDLSADPAVGEMPFQVVVKSDVPVWSNFWLGLGCLLVYPLYCWFRSYRFERARWADSDYSPYASSSSNDDS